jgi:hypothetical protein
VRAQPFQILNPVTGQYEQTIKPYYPRTIYDSYAMATGVAITGFKPFNNQSSQSLSSYVKGQNVFELNQGRVLYLAGDILGAAFASFKPITGIATASVLDDYTKLWSQHTLIIKQDGQDAQKSLFSELFPEPTWWNDAVTSGAAFQIAPPGRGGALWSQSTRRGVYLAPPLFVGNGRTLDFTITTTSTYAPAAALNTFVLRFVMALEEIQPDNPAPVRAG